MARRTLYVIVCAAPPARDVQTLLAPAQRAGKQRAATFPWHRALAVAG